MAHVLKTLDLRHWSGPLDWIFSMPGMARDCLGRRLRRLVDRNQLESIPEAERRGPDIWRGRHRLYRERHGLECVFNHHDPAASEADYAFLAEGVRRLRKALDTPGTDNRLWMMTHLHTPRETVEAIDDLLGRRPSRNHLTFLQLQPEHPRVEVVVATELRPTLRWLTVQTHRPRSACGWPTRPRMRSSWRSSERKQAPSGCVRLIRYRSRGLEGCRRRADRKPRPERCG